MLWAGNLHAAPMEAGGAEAAIVGADDAMIIAGAAHAAPLTNVLRSTVTPN